MSEGPAASPAPGLDDFSNHGRPGQELPTVAGPAFVTLPAERQRVHTRTRRTSPDSMMRTRRRFGSQRRLVLLFAWETLLPVIGRFPQTWQTFDIPCSLSMRRAASRLPPRVPAR